MRRRTFFFMLLFWVGGSAAQDDFFWKTRIKWSDVLSSANVEGKGVMVYCYSKRCSSCDEVEKNVFNSPEVSSALKNGFISLKFQVDSVVGNGKESGGWYSAMAEITRRHNVKSFPTFLFFNSEGDLLHKGIGVRSSLGFVSLIQEAANPEFQYFSLKGKGFSFIFESEKRVCYVLKTASLIRDSSMEKRVARKVIEYWESNGLKDKFIDAEIIRIVMPYVKSSDENLFKLLYPDTRFVDSLVQEKGFGDAMLNQIITRECIDAYIVRNGNYKIPLVSTPNWNAIENRIKVKYGGERAGQLVVQSRRRWYKHAKPDPELYAEAYVDYLIRYASLSTSVQRAMANNAIYADVFMKVKNKDVLRRAAAIEYSMIQADSIKTYSSNKKPYLDGPLAALMDTYANLLYKAGDVDRAIYWQREALKILKGNEELIGNFEKMKNGEPTWKLK